jgi:hypothetical protein
MIYMGGCLQAGVTDVPWECKVCGKCGHLPVMDGTTIADLQEALFEIHKHDSLFSGATLTMHIQIEMHAEIDPEPFAPICA